MASDEPKRDDLAFGGICPVCDEEFTDGYDELDEGKSYNARICVIEKDGKDEGSMLVHLDGECDVQSETDWDAGDSDGE